MIALKAPKVNTPPSEPGLSRASGGIASTLPFKRGFANRKTKTRGQAASACRFGIPTRGSAMPKRAERGERSFDLLTRASSIPRPREALPQAR